MPTRQTVDVDEVAGYAAAVRAEEVVGDGTLRGDAKVKRVERGGQAVGVDVKRVGG